MISTRHRKRSGFSLAEVMVVVGIMGALVLVVSPRVTEVRSKTALRAARQELTSAFAAARSSAMQKGKTSTLALTSGSATVSVLSGLNGTPVQVFQVSFDKELNSSLTALGSAPLTVTFDARGLLTSGVAGATTKYRLLNGIVADTLCVSGSGMILPRTCSL